MTSKQKSKLVKLIFKECSIAVKKGCGNKSVGGDARKLWTKRGLKSIRKQVNGGVDEAKWKKAKIRVIPTAKKMGGVARVLAGDRSIIPKWAAEAAAAAVKNDPKCPTAPGTGGFCP